ncbi:C40 family peptidase [Kushneria phosphatilytica]|nr:NlpC/P60 family protein [Kushneria phosphatilytica]OHV12874.1 hypothetical protein BH688_02305 [Kushneria phosphatilytica]
MYYPLLRRLALSSLVLLMLAGCAAQNTAPGKVDEAAALAIKPTGLMQPQTRRQPGKRLRSSLENFMRSVSLADIRETLLSEADAWTGTPYRYGGETRSGIDCSALVQRIYRDSFDISLPRTTAGQVLEGQRIERKELQPGDLIFFRPSSVGRHVGIYVDNGLFLHASSSSGVRLSRLDNPYWVSHYWQARRPEAAQLLVMRTTP